MLQPSQAAGNKEYLFPHILLSSTPLSKHSFLPQENSKEESNAGVEVPSCMWGLLQLKKNMIELKSRLLREKCVNILNSFCKKNYINQDYFFLAQKGRWQNTAYIQQQAEWLPWCKMLPCFEQEISVIFKINAADHQIILSDDNQKYNTFQKKK